MRYCPSVEQREKDQKDAQILHVVARCPESIRTGKFKNRFKKLYEHRLSRQTTREIFHLLIGEIKPTQTSLFIWQAYHRLLETVRFEQERYLRKRGLKQHKVRHA